MGPRLFPVLLLAACPAPPEIGGQDSDRPSIQLLYPPTDTRKLPLDADCHLRSLVVVDLDGIDFVPPGTATENVAGQGHWHVYLDPLSTYGMPLDMYYDLDMYEDGLKADVGTELRLWVQIQDNSHVPIECDGCEDAIEFELEDPLDCTPPPAGGA